MDEESIVGQAGLKRCLNQDEESVMPRAKAGSGGKRGNIVWERKIQAERSPCTRVQGRKAGEMLGKLKGG